MYRSILEGIAFEQLLAINAVEQSIGARVDEFVAIGGGATNNLWCHILADVTGRNICIPENTEASCLGAAIAPAVGKGWYGSFKEAAQKMTGIKRIIRPEVSRHTLYHELFTVYKRIYPGLRKAGIRLFA